MWDPRQMVVTAALTDEVLYRQQQIQARSGRVSDGMYGWDQGSGICDVYLKDGSICNVHTIKGRALRSGSNIVMTSMSMPCYDLSCRV